MRPTCRLVAGERSTATEQWTAGGLTMNWRLRQAAKSRKQNWDSSLETKLNQIAMQAADERSSAGRRTSKLILNADGISPGIPVTVADPEEPLKDIANRILIPVRSYTVEVEAVLWSLRNTTGTCGQCIRNLHSILPHQGQPLSGHWSRYVDRDGGDHGLLLVTPKRTGWG